MKKRMILLLAFVFTFSFPGLTQAEYPDGAGTTITIWHNWSTDRLAVIDQVVTEYESTHVGVNVNLVYQDNIPTALDTTIPAGTGPDIIFWGSELIGYAANKNQIIDLDQLGITTTWLNSTYISPAANGMSYGGKIWGIPGNVDGIALVYNSTLVTSEYLPVDRFDFAELRTKAVAFQTAKGLPLICNQGFPGEDSYHIATVFFGYGVPSYVDEAGNAYVNTPQAISAATWLQTMKPLSPAAQSYGDCQNQLLSGSVGMWWTGTWAIPYLENQGFSFGIKSMGNPFVNVYTYMITTNASSRGNALMSLDLIQYLTNAENSETITIANHTIPANHAALSDPDIQAIPVVAGFGADLSLGVPMSTSPYSECQWGPVGEAETAIWNGTRTPEAALNRAQLQIEICTGKTDNFIYLPMIVR